MPVKVNKDGQMVERVGGLASVGPTGKNVYAGYTSVETGGTVLKDEEVAEHLLEIVKAGDVPGLTYYDDEETARAAVDDESPEINPPQINKGGGQDPERVARLQGEVEDLKAKLSEANDRIAELEADADSADDDDDADDDGSKEPEYKDIEGYDPGKYNQPQVLDYLAGASPGEVKRVQDIEKAGQGRQQIMGFKPEGGDE